MESCSKDTSETAVSPLVESQALSGMAVTAPASTFQPCSVEAGLGWVDTNMMGRKRGDDCSKGPQVGYKPWATAARTQPLYMVHTLYQLSFWHRCTETANFTVYSTISSCQVISLKISYCSLRYRCINGLLCSLGGGILIRREQS